MSNFSFPSESYGLLLLSQDRLTFLWQIQWLLYTEIKVKKWRYNKVSIILLSGLGIISCVSDYCLFCLLSLNLSLSRSVCCLLSICSSLQDLITINFKN